MKDKLSEQRVALLHPAIRDEVASLIIKAEAAIDQTICIRVVQGVRTIEEQNAFYNQPWDGLDNDGDGKIDEADECVTKAKGGSSFHNYALALDICMLFKNNKGVYIFNEATSWLTGPNFRKIRDIFVNAGYKWGGTFSNTDNPHFEKTFGLGWRDCKSLYDSNQFIPGTRYIKIK